MHCSDCDEACHLNWAVKKNTQDIPMNKSNSDLVIWWQLILSQEGQLSVAKIVPRHVIVHASPRLLIIIQATGYWLHRSINQKWNVCRGSKDIFTLHDEHVQYSISVSYFIALLTSWQGDYRWKLWLFCDLWNCIVPFMWIHVGFPDFQLAPHGFLRSEKRFSTYLQWRFAWIVSKTVVCIELKLTTGPANLKICTISSV